MTDKRIDSLKHEKDKRARIPSKEEAGYEQEAPEGRKTAAAWPLNPVIHRGQDPELFWMEKYGGQDDAADLEVDIRSLYRVEHIAPEKLIQRLYRLKREAQNQGDMFVDELFANYHDVDELDKPAFYYKQADKWSNRLIQGDSLMVMGSLLEREGMAGQVQMVYMDPPYGIKYNSNWQMRLGDRTVKDGDDASLSGEPEVIKAFRDTWELGIHSYLSYLRDRLLVAKDLLTESGSCFVQISDENVHLVRCLMDEVFGSENFVSLISVKKTGLKQSKHLDSIFDYVLWYGKNSAELKYNQLYLEKELGVGKGTGERYDQVELPDGSRRALSKEEKASSKLLEKLVATGAKAYQLTALISESSGASTTFEIEVKGKRFFRTNWKTNRAGMEKLLQKGRIEIGDSTLRYIRYFDDFPATQISNYWDDTGLSDKIYVVQTSVRVIERCILMSTDPGDLVLDPTCGSGTTAYVAEQWGRRWITTDTSRVALNIAKTRLMTATFPWYVLTDEKNGLPREAWDVRHGFDYKTVQRVTLGSLANDEPPETVTLFDQAATDKKKLRVAGPFTVETLQSYDPCLSG